MLVFLAALLAGAFAAPEQYRVKSLPGWSGTLPTMYAGYVDVPGPMNKSTNHMFYWMVQATDVDPSTAPVVLWQTGGPGCSGLFALLTEQGPIHFDSSGGLVGNEWAWSRFSNFIWVESPCGVGFSYNDAGDYVTGDNETARVMHLFLRGFFSQFPELSGNPLFLAGESYSGHYTPQTASLVLQDPELAPQLKGWAVGNPSFDHTDGSGYFPLLASHGVVSLELFHQANQTCNGSLLFTNPYHEQEEEGGRGGGEVEGGEEGVVGDRVGDRVSEGSLEEGVLTPTNDFGEEEEVSSAKRQEQASKNTNKNLRGEKVTSTTLTSTTSTTSSSPSCSELIAEMRALAVGINPYSLIAPCVGKPSLNGGCLTTALATTQGAYGGSEGVGSQTFVPCINTTAAHDYLNRADVREAIHASPHAPEWSVCSSTVNYTQYAPTVAPLYHEMLGRVRVLVYSGSSDSCVPFLSTEPSMDNLGYPVKTPWRQWHTPDATFGSQVAGFTKQYDVSSNQQPNTPQDPVSEFPKDFYFATVRGAGHMCPTFRPEQSFYLFQRFINGSTY